MFPTNSGIPLGRVFGTQVVLSWFFAVFAVLVIMTSQRPDIMALYMAALLLLVFLHEVGHKIGASLVKGRTPLIVMGPFGGLAYSDVPDKWWAHLVTTACGPAMNAALIPLLYFAWPLVLKANNQYVAVFWGLAFEANIFLLVFNILPLYPMDGGRLLQQLMWPWLGYARSLMVAGMIGTVGGASLAVIGLNLIPVQFPSIFGSVLKNDSIFLGIIGIMLAVEAFGAYRHAQQLLNSRWR